LTGGGNAGLFWPVPHLSAQRGVQNSDPWLGQGAEFRLCVLDLLHDGEQVEGRTGQPIDPRRRHHVAGDHVFQQPQQLAPVRLRPAGRLPVNLRAAIGLQLPKLRIERLPIGADAGVAEAANLGSYFGHIFRKV